MKELKGYFVIKDATESHKQILYRSSSFDEAGNHLENVDLLFEGVDFMHIPFAIQNPTFSIGSKEEMEIIIKENDLDELFGRFSTLIKVDCVEGKGWLIGYRIIHCVNNLSPNKSSIIEETLDIDAIDTIIKNVDTFGVEYYEKDNPWEILKLD